MFERFTDRAQHVVVLAQAEASNLNHDYIGTEHLLLGLVSDTDSVAAHVLTSMDISLDEIREQLETMLGPATEAGEGHMSFTPGAKKVLELSLREALQLGHEHIGTEHVLLGLVYERDGLAAQVLDRLGVTAERARSQVVQVLTEQRAQIPVEAPSAARASLHRTARQETLQAEEMTGDQARCPRCNAAVADNLHARTVSVPTGGEDNGNTGVVLLWCGRCGALLGVLPGSRG